MFAQAATTVDGEALVTMKYHRIAGVRVGNVKNLQEFRQKQRIFLPCIVNLYSKYLIWESDAIIKKLISSFTQFRTLSIAIVVLSFTLLGYTLHHVWLFADQFDHLISQTTEKALDITNSQTDIEEIVSDIQETLVYDDTTVMSVTDINQVNYQITDDEWEGIYNYVDEVQVK